MPLVTELKSKLKEWELPRAMKPLKGVCNKEDTQYMLLRQSQNEFKARNNKAEQWMARHLSKTNLKWTPQAIHGFKLYDFWNAKRGLAVEVDGAGHNSAVDSYRDEYHFRRSAIIVIRVRNFSESDAAMALKFISEAEDWTIRRTSLQVKKRRLLTNQFQLEYD